MADVGFLDNLLRDLSVNTHFRGVLQPLIAIILGVRAGLTARAARPTLREALLPLVVAVAIDGILQYLTVGVVRPLAAVVVGLTLAWLPFALAREVTSHLWNHPRSGSHAPQPA